MLPEARAEARTWLAMAEEDLGLSLKLVGDNAFPRQASYGAQQAAEKALKAVLTALNLPFPKTHDLIQLAALIPTAQTIHAALADLDLATLTAWAVRGRYPHTGPAAMAEEAIIATNQATRILTAVSAWLETAD